MLLSSLDLESSRVSSTSSSLELSTLGNNLRSLTLVRTETKVSNGLSGVSWTSDKDGVLTLRSSQSQLVQGDSLTTSLQDSSLGTSSESQSGDSGLWGLQQSEVVGNGTNDNDGLLSSTLLLQNLVDSGKGNWRSVDLGKEQRSQDDLVERRVSTTWKLVYDCFLLLSRAQSMHSQKDVCGSLSELVSLNHH